MIMTYDIACPICGMTNRSLYLEETGGWMECECCGNASQDLRFRKRARIPVFQKDLKKQIGIVSCIRRKKVC